MRRFIVGVSLVLGLGVGFTAGARNGVVDRGGPATICAEPCDEYCQELGYSDGYCGGRRCVCIE
ncbi:hypothetical protein [Archangium lansingense]|uniref:Uncharacterized protein n=1 Tax=Archangium lansingense TaxID=2995310 RepID=A0ABT4A2V5_9BACT|nr:hypothetical protein [Archangium lansinium]MCY1075604.1 hypothetical protein [Archangium lansinium]